MKIIKIISILFAILPYFVCALVIQNYEKQTQQPNLIIKQSIDNTSIELITSLPPPCHSQIYCHGQLLETVQLSQIHEDSKTFVDMKLRYPPIKVLENFDIIMDKTNQNPNKQEILKFVKDNFFDPGKEFEPWTPNDWTEKPKFLDRIKDPDLKQWGSDLNGLWKILGRKMIDDVAKNPDFYSIIHVDHPVIIPGGRFREFYYWDSYWIIRGLLYSEMYQTARGMLENFLSIIDRYGFIPNGGRIYYLKRSQPPLLAAMIKSYVEFTGDNEFAIKSVTKLEHEFNFWMNNHTHIVNNGYILATYGDKSSGPRPESYREDIETSKKFNTEEEKQQHFSELKAAAESGMDFSSRWFIDENGTNNGTLKNLKTRSIIPVELNAILYWNAKIIADFYLKSGNIDKVNEFNRKADEILTAINTILWNDEIGIWLDYDLINNKSRNYFTPTNLSPLWMKCFDQNNADYISERIIDYINRIRIDAYPGGVPNTLQFTGEQWDYPNVWPPMQYILIMGLHELNTPKSKNLAIKWATRWVQSNFQAYKDSRSMFEKYNAEVFGGFGSGGEYEVQLGFGWTNGVIIELLERYGDLLTTSTGSACKTVIFPNNSIITVLIFICLIYSRYLLS